MTDGNYRNRRRDEFLEAQKRTSDERARILLYMHRWNLKRGRELMWPSTPRTSR